MLRFIFTLIIALFLTIPPFVSAISRNKTITVHVHNCKDSSRLLTVHVFDGNFNELRQRLPIIDNNNFPYTFLSQPQNVGQQETVSLQCNDQGTGRCQVKCGNAKLKGVRQNKTLYCYHYVKNNKGITKVSTDKNFCNTAYTN